MGSSNLKNPKTCHPIMIFTIFCLISQLVSSTDHHHRHPYQPWKKNITRPSSLPLSSDILAMLQTDPKSIQAASHDFGNITQLVPAGVLCPSSISDITSFINSVFLLKVPSPVAARGAAHSVRGQAMAPKGVVVNMTCLKSGVIVSGNQSSGFYADVGGEQLWIDVLNETLKAGLTPVSWTDYLYLTVGGTLSNGGISGQTFRHGPQIANVYELDVVTGKGEFVTCSPDQNPNLFYAVLGGLGQFGIITRARIPLAPAPKRAKWVKMVYTDFDAFSKDQLVFITPNSRKDYVEGSLLLDNGSPDVSFFPPDDQLKILPLIKQHGILYVLEFAQYYNDATKNIAEKELQQLMNEFNGIMYAKDMSYAEFINRVKVEEEFLRSHGLWEIPHPWLNLFIPKSRMKDFNNGVFRDIILKRNITKGLILTYPMYRSKWNDKMSIVIPDEEEFYTVGFLQTSQRDNLKMYNNQNDEIMRFCESGGIQVKQYLPQFRTKERWMQQFGSKWNTFKEMKALFDPKMILSPGQNIFN